MSTVRHVMLMAAGLAAAALVPFGCGKSGGGGTPAGGGAKVRVGFAQEGNESAWRKANTESIQAAAAKDAATIDLKFNDSSGQMQQQIQALDTFLQQRMDVVAFSPKEEKGWDPVLKRLKAANIPVICSDRNVKAGDPSLQPIYIGSDLKDEGRRAGEWLVKRTGGTAQIVILEGNQGGTATIDRTEGFLAGIAGHDGMKVIETRNADFQRRDGKSVMESILKGDAGKRVTALYAENDDMALGAIQALEQAGRRPGTDVVIISVDAIADGLKAVADGKLNATVECNPLLGPALMDAARKLKAGQPVPARIISVEALIDDPATAKKMYDQRMAEHSAW